MHIPLYAFIQDGAIIVVCQLLLYVCYAFGFVLSNFVYNGVKRGHLFFTISNGVRQGGILSPKLFSVYMDDLSNLLTSSGIGCFLDKVCFNHVSYADDLCLMALYAFIQDGAIIVVCQLLLYVCYAFGFVLSNFVYNGVKRGHLFSLFLTVFDKAESFPQNCFLFIWMIYLTC